MDFVVSPYTPGRYALYEMGGQDSFVYGLAKGTMIAGPTQFQEVVARAIANKGSFPSYPRQGSLFREELYTNVSKRSLTQLVYNTLMGKLSDF